MKSQYSFILIVILRFLSLFSLKRLRSWAKFLGPWLLSKDKRTMAVIERNLSLCFPHLTEQQRNELRQQRLIYMCQTFFEMSHIWTKSPEQVKSYLIAKYDNSLFEQQASSDGGIIILAPHVGNWEMMNFYLSQFRPLTAMYQPPKAKKLERFIRLAREKAGSVLVPTNNKGVIRIIRALKKNGMVAFLPDQVPDKNSGAVFAPFFNHSAYTMTLAHKLALKTNAKVFVGVAYQNEQGFSVNIEPVADSFYDNDAEVSARCLNKAVEQAVLYKPEQNQWEYKRYKRQPNDEKSLYN
jgi:KDO2-lipid IV(A) lauroyltransferase